MKEFIDKTSAQDGTLLDRKNLMAMQGFFDNSINISIKSVYKGYVVEIKENNVKNNEKLTTIAEFDSAGNLTSLSEELIGVKTIKKNINVAVINIENAIISEVLS